VRSDSKTVFVTEGPATSAPCWCRSFWPAAIAYASLISSVRGGCAPRPPKPSVHQGRHPRPGPPEALAARERHRHPPRVHLERSELRARPGLSRSINYDAFEPLVAIARDCAAKRFIYASTSSVYGVSEEENVTEDHPLVPLTDYNKYKGCASPFCSGTGRRLHDVTIRPATICGYSPRQRLDLTVNILTNLAVNNRKITIFGGAQKRPNLHIEDMTDLYVDLLSMPASAFAGKTFNAGYQNHTVADLGRMVHSSSCASCHTWPRSR